MQFANPMMLHGLWLALAPIVIHLLNRRRAVMVAFSHVALIQQLQQDRMRRVRLKQWLLLILRTLMIAFMALAFARPTIQGVGEGTHTTGVLLMDRSLSMAHGEVFDTARSRVESIVSSFQAQDDLHLIAFDDRAERLGNGQVGTARLAISDIRPTFRSTDVLPALDLALERLVASSHLNRELYVVSDRASHGWRTVSDSLPGFEGLTVYLVDVEPPRLENVGIRDLSFSGLISVGASTTLAVEIDNHGDVPRTDVALSVYLAGRRVVRRLVAIQPRSSSVVQLPLTPERGGDLVVRAEIQGGDGYAADDARETVLHVPTHIATLVVGEEEDRYFIEQALAASPQGIRTDAVTIDQLTTEALDSADVVALCSLSSVPRPVVDAVLHHVELGGGLLVVLGQVDVRDYNSNLLSELGVGRLVGVAGRPGSYSHVGLNAPGRGHPLVDDLVAGESFVSPSIYVRYRMQADAETTEVLGYADGSAALVERAVGAGRVLVLTTHTAPKWSDLAVSGLFVPLVHRAVRYLATGTFGRSDFLTGQEIERPVQDPLAREAQLRLPDGTSRTVWSEDRGGRRMWILGSAEVPGTHEVYARERLVDRVAVNVPATESDLARIDRASVGRALAGAEVVELAPADGVAEHIRAHRRGRELWRPTLLLTLALMVAELWLIRGENRGRWVVSGSEP